MSGGLTWEEFGIQLALLASRRSKDPKHKVGAAIISNTSHTPVALGYNGRAPGEVTDRESLEVYRSGYIHAEANALIAAGSRFVHGEEHTLYCTHEPCDGCARLILRSNAVHQIAPISRVVFLEPYKDPWRISNNLPSGGQILLHAGLVVEQAVPRY